MLYGGKLGTTVLEMGLLSEDDVTRSLSKLFGVPTVSPDRLTAIPPYVIQKLPRQLAKKHNAIPLKRNNFV